MYAQIKDIGAKYKNAQDALEIRKKNPHTNPKVVMFCEDLAEFQSPLFQGAQRAAVSLIGWRCI